MASVKESKKRTMEGVVVGTKMTKTVKVKVSAPISHPRYKKVVQRWKVFMAHTEKDLNVGDSVVIEETRPYSKNVKWLIK